MASQQQQQQQQQQHLLSPAELAYLHASLSAVPPIRPDGRATNQFRPLVAETDILPGTNGSARICFADGTEAIIGVKAEVEKTKGLFFQGDDDDDDDGDYQREKERGEKGGEDEEEQGQGGQKEWVELTVEIPGYRDDDSGSAFLAAMLSEALLADGGFVKKLWINRRFHWKLYLDVCCLPFPLPPFPPSPLYGYLPTTQEALPRLIWCVP
jgi:exosome complex component RRP42